MRSSVALAMVLALSGCAVVLLPARAVQVAGSQAIRAVTPDGSDMP